MVTSTNHVIAWPDLHRARPFGDFCNIFQPNIGEDQKSHDFSSGPLAGTASYYGKSGPD